MVRETESTGSELVIEMVQSKVKTFSRDSQAVSVPLFLNLFCVLWVFILLN